MQNGCEIFAAKGLHFHNQRLISQLCNILPSTWSDVLAMAVTPSFQLRIMHHLKHWIVDFLSFEMTYSMHKLNFRKCSKNGWNNCHQECFMLDFSLLPLLAFRICLWQRTLKLRFFMFLSFPFSLPWIPKNSPQSQIAFGIKKLSKHQNLTQFD